MKYHINLDKGKIENSRLAILPGDPGRVPLIMELLDAPNKLASNREYVSGLGYSKGAPILVISTGIGGPSTSICVDELAQLGVDHFIRVGTTGAINKNVLAGDLIITTGSVRLDGASRDFAPIEYPAVADFFVTKALEKAALQLDVRHHIGITVSTDTFYQAQERHNGFSSFLLPKHHNSTERWRKLNALNYEMESSVLFTMCASFGLKAGCVSGVITERGNGENIDLPGLVSTQKMAAEVAVIAAKAIESNFEK